ncbi:MAG: metal-binding protein, partial [Novosphingobium sp.]
MAREALPEIPFGSPPDGNAAMQHGHWRKRIDLASGLTSIERFLASAGFDRAPWLVVGFAAGIGAWFGLPYQWHWLVLIAICVMIGASALGLLRPDGRWPWTRQAVAALTLAVALGCGHVWLKSELVGAAPIARPQVAEITGAVLSRQEQPA